MDDNIHAPTVPSGPRSGGTGFKDLSKLSMVELMNEKERIEAELSALSSVLTSVSAPLKSDRITEFRLTSSSPAWSRHEHEPPHAGRVSTQRYRRSTKYVPDSPYLLEIHLLKPLNSVRITRARIIHLRNDHKEVMKYLEKGLHAHFEALRQAQGAPTGDSTTASTSASASTSQPHIPHETSTSQAGMVETPFARVNSVASGSPADQAGLKAGDTIRSFGGVNWVNHERLTKIGEVVQQNEGVRNHFSSTGVLNPAANEHAAPHRCQSSTEERNRSRDHGAQPEPCSSAQLGWTRPAWLPPGSIVTVLSLRTSCNLWRHRLEGLVMKSNRIQALERSGSN